jgi:hypothetical protein
MTTTEMASPLASPSFIFPPFYFLSTTEDTVVHIVHAGPDLKLDERRLSIFPEERTAEDGFPRWRKESVTKIIIPLPRVNERGVVDITKFVIDVKPGQLEPELVDQRHDPMTFDGDDVLQHAWDILRVETAEGSCQNPGIQQNLTLLIINEVSKDYKIDN